MSMSYAEQLLRKYNATKTDTIVQTEPEPSKGLKLATWSYANTYDALYDKYSKDKNFNLDMWHEAIKRGEQDTYLGFLEQNQNNDLGIQYYDPGYYDYETMMLELYKGLADNTNKVERFTDVYNPETNEWDSVSIGEMTEQEHIQYQLDQAYSIKKEALIREREQWEKDQMTWLQTFGHDIASTLGELGEGIIVGLTGLIDVVAAPIFATGAALSGGGTWGEMFVDYISDYSLTSMEKATIRAALDEYERTHTHFRDIDGNMTGVGTYVAGMANSIGMMIPAIVSTAVGAPGWLSTGIFYGSSFTGNVYENATNDKRKNSPAWLKIVNAGVKTGAELVIEKALGDFLGGTIQNRLIGIGGKKALGATLSKGAGLKYVTKSALQEGLEEFLQDFGTNCIDQFTGMLNEGWRGYGDTGVTFQTLVDSFLVGALSSLVLSGGTVGTSAIRSAAVNYRAKQQGLYNEELKIGPGDTVIEIDGKPKKLKGFTKLYFNSILSDFQLAVEELKNSKLKTGKSIKLAQEIYSAINTLTEYYSSFDKNRILNCETLLNRVISAENDTELFREMNPAAGRTLSDDTISRIIAHDKTVRKEARAYSTSKRQDFATYVEGTFTSMVYDAPARLTAKIATAAKEAQEELEAGGVKKVLGAVDQDGNKYSNPELKPIEDMISRKAQDNLEVFRKDPDFEFIFATDGHVAVEEDGVLFVPVSWLENYTTSEIYETLDRSKVLDTIIDDETLAPFSKDVLKFVREFTKQPTMTMKDAYMQLLFNESVYQGFLLSGENAHTHQRVVFRLVALVKNLAEGSGYLLKSGTATPRTLNKYLRELDELVDNNISSKAVKGKYENILQELIDLSKLDKYKQNKSVQELVNSIQRDYQQAVKYKKTVKEFANKLRKDVKAAFKSTKTVEKSDYKKTRLTTVTDAMKKAMRPGTLKAIINWAFDPQQIGAQTVLTEKDLQFIRAYKARREILRGGGTRSAYKHLKEQLMPYVPDKYRAFVEAGLEKPINHPDRLQAIAILDDVEESLYSRDDSTIERKYSGLGAITIPYDAAANFDTQDAATIQYVSDKMKEFYELYGISHRNAAMCNDLQDLVMTVDVAKRENILEAIKVFDATTPENFVYSVLGALLGDEYIVTSGYRWGEIKVAKKIPADVLFSKDFLDMSIEDRDDMFRDMFFSLEKNEKDYVDEKVAEAIEDFIAEIEFDRDSYLNELDETYWDELVMHLEEDPIVTYRTIKEDGVDPVNDEAFFDVTSGEIYNEKLFNLFNELKTVGATISRGIPLGKFINVSKFNPAVATRLKDVKVLFEPPVRGQAGFYSQFTNEIIIRTNFANYFETLTHEINHALQHIYGLPGGFNNDTVRHMPKLMKYVVDNYRVFVEYLVYRKGHIIRPDYSTDYILEHYKDSVATAGYMLVQGEILARADVHNKTTSGLIQRTGYLMAPDGTYFEITYDTQNTSLNVKETQNTELPQPVAENALVRTMINVLEARSKNDTTDSYHTTLSRVNADDILDDILSDGISPMVRTFVTLDQVIRDPDNFLNDDIMKIIGRRFDEEGYVYSVLKTYVESHYKGISIDRTGDTHQYVFVDNNAFDDLLYPTTKRLAGAETTKLYEQYHQKGVPLSMFYKPSELKRLGISDEVKVFISPNVDTEFIVDKDNKFGLINIRASEKTTDSIIIDKLNHEFRHVLQVYNNLETGFTTDIEVTAEMIKDVKKHVPELFTNERVKAFVKSMAGDTSDTNIVRHFIYTLVGGELNAYGIRANIVESKPIYAVQDGNNLTIFMPWYDAKTHEGQYDTMYKKHGLPAELMPQGKNKEKSNDKSNDKSKKSRAVSKKQAGDTNLKHFIKEGRRTQIDPDLQDFIVMTTGFEDQLPKPISQAIEKGYLTKQSLFKWFRQADINDINEFTFDLMNKCFFHNDHITSVKDLERLVSDEVVDLGDGKSVIVGPAFYWAAATALREIGLGLEYIAMRNDLNYFLEYISTFAGTQLRTKIVHNMEKFYHTYIQTRAGDNGWQEVEFDYGSSVAHGYTRLTAMRYFDGSLGGAFLMANSVRETLKSLWISKNSKQSSTDESFDKDDDERTVTDTLDAAFFQKEYDEIEDADALFKFTKRFVRKGEAEPSVGNDIIMAYELTHKPSRAKMIDFISAAAQHLQASNAVRELAKTETISKTTAVKIFEALLLGADELKKRTTDIEIEYENLNPELDASVKKKPNWEENWKRVRKDFKFYTLVDKAWNIYEKSRVVYQKKLEQARDEALYDRYIKLSTEIDVGVPSNKYTIEIDGKTLKTDRNSIQNRLNQHHKYITEQLKNGVIKITQLPDDVRSMFDEKTFEFKKEYGRVGRGKTETGKASGGTTYETYIPKHDIRNSTEEFQHDTTEILRVEQRLRDVKFAIVQELKTRKEQFAERTATQKRADKAAKRAEQALVKQIQENQLLKAKLGEAEEKLRHNYKVKRTKTSKKKSSRSRYTKTERTEAAKPIMIRSDVKTPDVLADIFDTTFDYMADTLVQFASRDEDGNLYTKDDKNFNSRLKHEVATWDAFYEANSKTLQNLTHTDVLKIVEFFYKGMPMAIGTAQGKLNAIETFTLGYILDVGRRNIFGWNLSVKTLDAIEQLYEAKSSSYGSGLNAVAQMKKVVNPFKKVQQRMLDEFNIQEHELNDLIGAVDNFQAATTDDARVEKGKIVMAELKKLEILMIERGSATPNTFWDKIQSYRYMSMLSSPVTWVRNGISNSVLFGANKLADWLGNMIFPKSKRAYRKDQWDLSKVKIRDDVKDFIDINIKNSELFDPLYKMQGKYEQRKKDVDKQRDLFMALLTKALKEKYMVEHRFDRKRKDNKSIMNNLSKFVNHMISDDKFIKSTASTYFGKILTLEIEAGRADISKGFTNELLNLFADAVLLANEDYMHKRSFMADMIDNLRDKHPAAYHILHTWQPFLNSSFNWFVETLKYTPLGLVSGIYKSVKLERTIAKLDALREKGNLTLNSRLAQYLARRDLGKGMIGMILLIVGMIAGASGRIAIDEDENDKNKFYLYAGDIKIDISAIFSSSSLLIGTALVQGAVRDDVGFDDIMNAFSEQMFADFILNDILSRHRWDEGFWDGVLTETESVLRSFVPQVVQLFARVCQQKQVKYTPGIIGMFERFVNSFSPVPVGERKIDPYTGEEYTKYALPIVGNILASGILGSKIYWTEVSEAEQMAMDVGLKKGQLTGELTIDGKKYQIDDVKALQIKYGQLNKEDLAKIKSQKHKVEMPDGNYKTLSWDAMSDKQRRNVIDRTMTQNAKIAKIYMWTQIEGKKYYASDSLYVELKRLGITKNVYRGDKGFAE